MRSKLTPGPLSLAQAGTKVPGGAKRMKHREISSSNSEKAPLFSVLATYLGPEHELGRCVAPNLGLFSHNICFRSGPRPTCLTPDATLLRVNPGIMTQRLITIRILAAILVVGFSAVSTAAAQGVTRDTVPRPAQKPAARNASMDSLVVCSPVAAPAKKAPVAHRRRVPSRSRRAAAVVPEKAAAKTTPKPAPLKATPKPAHRKVALATPHKVAHRARRVTPKPVTSATAHTTTVVMCRPVRPLAPLAMGTPTEQSVVPVPRLASVAAPPAVAEPAAEEGPPLFVSTAPGVAVATAGGRSWLPFAVVPALFIPFIHGGRTHHASTPIDTTTPPDTTTTPVIPPPTTVPEPGTIAMLGTGLLGLAEISRRRSRRGKKR
jgi:hypothetical protein